MAKLMPVGARAEVEMRVEFQHTLTKRHPSLPPVLSTPNMLELMELACFHALQPYCEGDEITVGAAINIEHLAPTGMGALVKAEAVLESSDARNRFHVCRVRAWSEEQDGRREIGRGTVTRAVVSLGRFRAKVGK